MKQVMAVLALVFLAACGDSPTGPGAVDIDGSWTGILSTVTVTITITENRGTITGSGNLVGPGGSIAATITGTRANASLSMTLNATGYFPMNFTGTVVDRATITGTFTGSGFTNEPITLLRR